MDFHIGFDWRLLMTLNAAQLNNDTKTGAEGKLLCFFLEKQKKISSLLKKNCWPPRPPPHYRDQARWPHREMTSWSIDKNWLEKHEVRRQTIEKSKQKKDSKVRHHFYWDYKPEALLQYMHLQKLRDHLGLAAPPPAKTDQDMRRAIYGDPTW